MLCNDGKTSNDKDLNNDEDYGGERQIQFSFTAAFGVDANITKLTECHFEF